MVSGMLSGAVPGERFPDFALTPMVWPDYHFFTAFLTPVESRGLLPDEDIPQPKVAALVVRPARQEGGHRPS